MSGLIALSNVIHDFRQTDGTMNAGGTLEFFENLTLTPKDVFNAYGSATPLSNPLQLDAGGFEPGVWLGPGVYRIRCRGPAPSYPSVLGPVIWTKDNVSPVVITITTNYTDAATISVNQNGEYITTTATLTLPSAAAAGASWLVHIKNIGTESVVVARTGGGDTIDGVTGNLNLHPNLSVTLIVNSAATGYSVYANGLAQVQNPISGHLLRYGSKGPEWVAVDTRNTGGKLYNYSHFI